MSGRPVGRGAVLGIALVAVGGLRALDCGDDGRPLTPDEAARVRQGTAALLLALPPPLPGFRILRRSGLEDAVVDCASPDEPVGCRAEVVFARDGDDDDGDDDDDEGYEELSLVYSTREADGSYAPDPAEALVVPGATFAYRHRDAPGEPERVRALYFGAWTRFAGDAPGRLVPAPFPTEGGARLGSLAVVLEGPPARLDALVASLDLPLLAGLVAALPASTGPVPPALHEDHDQPDEGEVGPGGECEDGLRPATDEELEAAYRNAAALAAVLPEPPPGWRLARRSGPRRPGPRCVEEGEDGDLGLDEVLTALYLPDRPDPGLDWAWVLVGPGPEPPEHALWEPFTHPGARGAWRIAGRGGFTPRWIETVLVAGPGDDEDGFRVELAGSRAAVEALAAGVRLDRLTDLVRAVPAPGAPGLGPVGPAEDPCYRPWQRLATPAEAAANQALGSRLVALLPPAPPGWTRTGRSRADEVPDPCVEPDGTPVLVITASYRTPGEDGADVSLAYSTEIPAKASEAEPRGEPVPGTPPGLVAFETAAAADDDEVTRHLYLGGWVPVPTAEGTFVLADPAPPVPGRPGPPTLEITIDGLRKDVRTLAAALPLAELAALLRSPGPGR